MKRVRIRSTKANAEVYFKLPQADPKRRYKLTVEKLRVPTIRSQKLNGHLFTIERRLRAASTFDVDDPPQATIALPAQHPPRFVAKDVITPVDLLEQMNRFFKHTVRRAVTYKKSLAAGSLGVEDDDDQKENYQTSYNIPTLSATWNNLPQAQGLETQIDTALRATLSESGMFGFMFAPESISTFVIRLTELGRRVLGFDAEWVAPGDDHFLYGYTIDNGQYTVSDSDPLVTTQSVEIASQHMGSLFSHVRYRQEVVLSTDLPLNNKLCVDGKTSHLRQELASYLVPTDHFSVEHAHDRTRRLKFETSNTHVFERSMLTNNKYELTATELQNFKVRLQLRQKEFIAGAWSETLVDFPMGDHEYFIVQLNLRPIR